MRVCMCVYMCVCVACLIMCCVNTCASVLYILIHEASHAHTLHTHMHICTTYTHTKHTLHTCIPRNTQTTPYITALPVISVDTSPVP